MKFVIEMIYIGCGGFLGAVSRYWVSGAAHQAFGDNFPHGTLVVNAAGSFFLGLVSFLVINRQFIGDNMRLAICIGFLGAFTTFSTFSYETFDLIKEGSYYLSAVNIITNLTLCLIMVSLGFALGALIDKML